MVPVHPTSGSPLTRLESPDTCQCSARLRILSVICLLILAICFSAEVASAQTITVNTTADATDANPGDGKCETTPGNGVCTLRAAIQEANATAGPNTIVVPTGVYQLTIPGTGEHAAATGDLNIYNAVTIAGAGPGQTIIDGGGLDRVFNIESVGIPVSISNLNIRNGYAYANGIPNLGGGIYNNGDLTLTNVVLNRNTAGVGGALFTVHGSATLNNVVVSHNWAPGGDGAGIYTAGALTVRDSTLTGNDNGLNSNAIYVNAPRSSVLLERVTITGNYLGLVGTSGNPVTIINSTISNNTSDAIRTAGPLVLTNVTVAGNGGTGINMNLGTASPVGPVQLTNTVIANNTGGNCFHALLVSLGHNVDSDGSCSLNAAGDLTNVDPRLGPLQDNGGATSTQALLPRSPAIDAGTNVNCPATDQRGVTRPQGGSCDIGAYEYAPPRTSASITGDLGNAGWYRSSVSLGLSSTTVPYAAAVASIEYSASGAQTIASTNAAGSAAMINLTAMGQTTVSYAATDTAGAVESTKTTTVKIDSEPPSCRLTAVGTNAQGQRYVQITAQDGVSGLASITPTTVVNATLSIPSFTAGTTSPIVFTATKIDQTRGAQIAVDVTDAAGNATSCDPVLAEVISQKGKAGWQVYTGLSSSEHLIRIENGDPGLTRLLVVVNRRVFDVTRLTNGEVRTIDVASAMQSGDANTIVLRGYGKKAASASVVIWDGNGQSPALAASQAAVTGHARGRIQADKSSHTAVDALLEWQGGSPISPENENANAGQAGGSGSLDPSTRI